MREKKVHALTVSYERLKTFGCYENVRVGMTVEVPDDERAEDTLEKVKVWVEEQIASEISKPQIEWKSDQLKTLNDEISQKRIELQTLREQLTKGKAILDAFIQQQ